MCQYWCRVVITGRGGGFLSVEEDYGGQIFFIGEES